MIKCQNCKSLVPESPFCLNCGYPLYNMNQKGVINNDGGVVPNTPLVHENAEIDERRKTLLINDLLKEVEFDAEPSGVLGSKDLLWIRMLKKSRMNNTQIREIVAEWMMLIKKIKEISKII